MFCASMHTVSYRCLLTIVFLFISAYAQTDAPGSQDNQPTITGITENVTLTEGKSFTLTCDVEHVGENQVSSIQNIRF